jgi:hypothetical protein
MHRPCFLFAFAAMFLLVNVASAADIPEERRTMESPSDGRRGEIRRKRSGDPACFR